jgi:lipopolysaccharide/colanic/teichoic acid biosynthesis glycosyltransferase
MKRLFDLVILLLLSPFLLVLLPVIYLLILFSGGRPVIFTQARGGYQGKPFNIYKFCSMNNKKDAHGQLLPDKQRLTRLGSFLRKTSLDELPSLYNVLKADMSLVGPRPFIADYLPLYNTHQRRRHDVKPGITGWAQINGRNGISWSQKFELDLWYVDHCGFALDVKILWLTLIKVFKRQNVNADEQVGMERFTGKPELRE